MPVAPGVGWSGFAFVAPQERGNGADLACSRLRGPERVQLPPDVCGRLRGAKRPDPRLRRTRFASTEAELDFARVGVRFPRRAPLGERGVERRRVLESDLYAVDVEADEGRPQQPDGGLARAAGPREREHEIQQRGVRLGRERQRIERLVGHARVGQHLACEVEVRQRAVEDDRGRFEGARGLSRASADGARDLPQFLFAIARDKAARPCRLRRGE